MRTTIAAVILVTSSVALFAQAPQYGAFHFRDQKDPMTDTSRAAIMTQGQSKSSLFLGWACREDGLNVLFSWGEYLIGSDGSIQVQHRFPPAVPVSMTWGISTNHQIGFVPMNRVSAFTAQAMQEQTLVLRAVDKDGSSVTETFSLDGLASALRKLPCAGSVTSTR